MAPRRALGIALITGGGVLALFLPGLEFFWFEGRSLGILLVVLGVVEIADGARRSRAERSPGLLVELGEDLGLTRDDDRRRDDSGATTSDDHSEN